MTRVHLGTPVEGFDAQIVTCAPQQKVSQQSSHEI